MAIHRYTVSHLAAFTFMAPLFGVILGGLVLKEPVTDGVNLDRFGLCGMWRLCCEPMRRETGWVFSKLESTEFVAWTILT
jgi:hypothetical protein